MQVSVTATNDRRCCDAVCSYSKFDKWRCFDGTSSCGVVPNLLVQCYERLEAEVVIRRCNLEYRHPADNINNDRDLN
jgi:hypothetical protein